MPPKPPAPALPQITTGIVDRVPCCHCGKPNNFRGHHEMLDTGSVFACDHCHRPMQIVRVQEVKMVSVRAPRGAVSPVRPRR